MPDIESFPGKRFVVEGNDGTGKSTVTEMMLWQFAQNGYETLQIDEPGSAIDTKKAILVPAAKELRDAIKDGSYEHNPHADLAMFTAARFVNWTYATRPLLERGGVAGQARDYTSSQVYQGYADGLGIGYAEDMTRLAMVDPLYFEPDFKTVLGFKNEVERLKRIDGRGELEIPDTFESRGESFQQRLNEGYFIVAERDGLDITEIEADMSREYIADMLLEKMLGKTGMSLTHYSWGSYWEERAVKTV